MKKRILSIILVCVMLVSLLPTFALAAPVYGDTNGHWAADAIDRWSGYGVVNGKGEGSFDPDGQMTRAEAAQVFANLLGLNKEGDISAYPDAQGKWYSEAIAKCVAAGILNGKGAGKMDPNGTITREEFLTMYARAICISNGADATEAKGELSQKGYTDTAKVSDWAADSIGTLVEKGFVNGLTATELAPKANINRASVMALLNQSVSTYVGKDSTETTVAAKSDGITLIANPAVTTVTGTADVVVVAAGAEQYDTATGEIAHNDIRVESAKMPVARVQGENITVTLALSTTADDATVTETGVDSIIVIESTAAVKNAAVAAEGAKIIVKDGAKAESVTVAETAKSATVETAKNATVGTVTIAAESATASVAGKVETVTVAETAKSAAVETAAGSTVGTLNVAAEDAKTTVAGKVETVKVEETAKNVAVETTSTAKVTTVENKAENTAVTGSGSVGAVKSSEDVKVETKNTKVENTSETKDIAVTDSKGTETKVDSGSTGQTTPSAPTGGGGGGDSHSHYFGADGTVKCSCGKFADDIVVAIGSQGYKTLKDAVAAAETGNTITVVKNFSETGLITFPAEKTLTLDLNGQTVTATGDNIGRWAYVNGNLTVKGSGYLGDATHNSTGYIFYVFGTLTLEGTAKYESGLEVAEMRSETSKLYVKDGYFVGDQYGERYWTFNKLDTCKDAALIEISGGTFENFNPAESNTEAPTQNWVKPGYKAVKQNTAPETWKVESLFAGGSGTEDDPFLIADAEQLENIRDIIDGGYCFKLVNNIDTTDKDWLPLGYGYYNKLPNGTVQLVLEESRYFVGTFDGNNKTIKLKHHSDTANYSGGNLGDISLFGTPWGAEIKNLTIDVDFDITAKGVAACGLAYQAWGKFENITVNGKINSTSSSAGLVYAASYSQFKNCTNNADITVTYKYTNEEKNGDAYQLVGGIAGDVVSGYGEYPEYDAVFDNCKNTGNLTNKTVTNRQPRSIMGAMYAQAINGTTTKVTLTNCSNTGVLTGYEASGPNPNAYPYPMFEGVKISGGSTYTGNANVLKQLVGGYSAAGVSVDNVVYDKDTNTDALSISGSMVMFKPGSAE